MGNLPKHKTFQHVCLFYEQCTFEGMREGGRDEAAAEYNGRAARLLSHRRAAPHCAQQDGRALQRPSEQG